MGGRVVDNLLKSFEDPVLSKWIVVALTLSVMLNGYLFNAAKWSIGKEPLQMRSHHAVDPKELDQAERFNNSASTPVLRLPNIDPNASDNIPPTPIRTPATTDDEDEGLVMAKPQNTTHPNCAEVNKSLKKCSKRNVHRS
ncbi:hypothetical protein EYC84_004907 [Monilinia fructicola]|uniref:Uncharacterized protein n=1 Tax=Monilinia fructicola TaxID=38448 RepID=A0A5M9K6H9_MONFR|nr:hypothetical protein EYC84_004907 [Monilinia fructicola]